MIHEPLKSSGGASERRSTAFPADEAVFAVGKHGGGIHTSGAYTVNFGSLE